MLARATAADICGTYGVRLLVKGFHNDEHVVHPNGQYQEGGHLHHQEADLSQNKEPGGGSGTMDGERGKVQENAHGMEGIERQGGGGEVHLVVMPI
jgi:hypothetical protein